jgi:hypothetical protein
MPCELCEQNQEAKRGRPAGTGRLTRVVKKQQGKQQVVHKRFWGFWRGKWLLKQGLRVELNEKVTISPGI